MGRKVNLSRDDWIAAALDWIAEHGVPTLAVEPLARSLGVTKGGFYWCFASRDELLAAALERWEAIGTQGVIHAVEQMPDARTHARELLMMVTGLIESTGPEAARSVRLQYALGCAANDPRVAPTYQRATAARVGFLVKVLVEAGQPQEVAEQRALVAHAAYIGFVQLLATHNAGAASAVNKHELINTFLPMLLAPVSPTSP